MTDTKKEVYSMQLKKVKKLLFERFGTQVSAHLKDSCLILTGTLQEWSEVVEAGMLSVDKKRSYTVVNKIKCLNAEIPPMRLPLINDTALDKAAPDVLIIGAGIIGASIARELSKWDLDILIVEKEHDIALHASSRNDGMVHPGIDLKKGYVKQKYNALGNKMYDKISSELNVPFNRCGQYICFKKNIAKLFLFLARSHWKYVGIDEIYALNRKEIKKAEPTINDDIKSALYFPSAGIVSPYELTIAYAENAVENGVTLSLDTAVIGMEVHEGKITSISTNRGIIYPKIIINAAGVFSEDVAIMAKDHFFSIHPRQGTNSILDKKSKHIVNTIISTFGTSSKSNHTKGGGIVSTIDGNVLIGPNALETYKKEDFSTQASSISDVFKKQKETTDLLSTADIITYFTGVRAPTYEEDFVVEKGRFTKNIIHAAGIQSPGLTAAPAIAVEIEKIIVDMISKFQTINPNKKYNPIRKAIPHTAKMSTIERARLIKKRSDYGEIICRCEEISRGEIIDALNRPVPCDTIDGVKRRVRPGMGRCQGGFCGPLVAGIIAEVKGIPLSEVKKSGNNSELLFGETKVGVKDDL